jgi:P27 family predicted phage terminase small subunit
VKPGPKPQPANVKALQGIRPSLPAAKRPPDPAGTPLPPRSLPPAGREIWRFWAPKLTLRGGLSDLDLPMFTLLCREWARGEAASAVIAAEGVVLHQHGRTSKHPANQVLREASATVIRLALEFGLTPASRGEALGPPADPDDEDSLTMMQLLDKWGAEEEAAKAAGKKQAPRPADKKGGGR